MTVILLILLFVILNVVDALLTESVLKRGGKEINPIIKKFGLYQIKIAGTLLFILLGVLSSFLIVFIVADLILLGVCGWNLAQWMKQRAIRKWVKNG